MTRIRFVFHSYDEIEAHLKENTGNNSNYYSVAFLSDLIYMVAHYQDRQIKVDAFRYENTDEMLSDVFEQNLKKENCEALLMYPENDCEDSGNMAFSEIHIKTVNDAILIEDGSEWHETTISSWSDLRLTPYEKQTRYEKEKASNGQKFVEYCGQFEDALMHKVYYYS